MFKKPGPKMEAAFQSYMFKQICKEGGTRMQLSIGDLAADMQKKLDPLDDANLYRKAFGNMQEALKQISHPFYILDSMEIDMMHEKGQVSAQDYQIYEKTYEQNQLQLIEVMKLNYQNECKNCGQKYPIKVNEKGDCPATQEEHEPLHQY